MNPPDLDSCSYVDLAVWAARLIADAAHRDARITVVDPTTVLVVTPTTPRYLIGGFDDRLIPHIRYATTAHN